MRVANGEYGDHSPKYSRNSNEMVKLGPLKVAKRMNSAKMAKVHQNRRKKLNKLIISSLFGGNGKNGKNRQSLGRTSNEMAKEMSKPQALKLQKYSITPFKGDYREWLRFWNQFVVDVDNSKMSEITNLVIFLSW